MNDLQRTSPGWKKLCLVSLCFSWGGFWSLLDLWLEDLRFDLHQWYQQIRAQSLSLSHSDPMVPPLNQNLWESWRLQNFEGQLVVLQKELASSFPYLQFARPPQKPTFPSHIPHQSPSDPWSFDLETLLISKMSMGIILKKNLKTFLEFHLTFAITVINK